MTEKDFSEPEISGRIYSRAGNCRQGASAVNYGRAVNRKDRCPGSPRRLRGACSLVSYAKPVRQRDHQNAGFSIKCPQRPSRTCSVYGGKPMSWVCSVGSDSWNHTEIAC